MNEFTLIDQFFKSIPLNRKDVVFGIGDDAACVQVPIGMELLVSTDTLVSEIHFLPEWDAYDIAYKSVMVNVSDMAAMAAQPCWITLSLTMPHLNQDWLDRFSKGINDSVQAFNIDLIGGDTTHGPLSITVTILGLAPSGQAVRRNGARAGDLIMVTGELGAAALAVKFLTQRDILESDKSILMDKLLHPKPRVDFTPLLLKYATSAIDISDGLGADLNHICVSSEVGALLDREAIPVHPLLVHYLKDDSLDLALSGGDDYELCFTIAPEKLDNFLMDIKKADLICYPIGVMDNKPGIRFLTEDNQCEEYEPKGYSHF